MKRSIILCLCVCMMLSLLFSCAKIEPALENSSNAVNEGSRETAISSGAAQPLTEPVSFSSIDDLQKYYIYVLGKDKLMTPDLDALAQEGQRFVDATLTDTYYAYHFQTDLNPVTTPEEYGFVKTRIPYDVEDENGEVHTEYSELYAINKGEEEYVFDEADLNDFAQRLTLTCFYDQDGEASLMSFSAMNSVEYWENHPGYYYTRVPISTIEKPLAYMVYWVKDNRFCQAAVPSSNLDFFLDNVEKMLQ